MAGWLGERKDSFRVRVPEPPPGQPSEREKLVAYLAVFALGGLLWAAIFMFVWWLA